MKLIEILREHELLKYTGNLNFLDKKQASLLGQLKCKDGTVVAAAFKNITGIVALKRLLFMYLLKQESYKITSEPEIVDEVTFNLSINDLIQEITDQVSLIKETSELKPPMDIKLKINPNFIKERDEVTDIEMDLLLCISEFNQVKDLYSHLPYYDPEITQALVSLRKKNALLVL